VKTRSSDNLRARLLGHPVSLGTAVARRLRVSRTEDAEVNDGPTREILAKSRRLVLLSRNLLRLLAGRIELADRLKADIRASAVVQSGRQATTHSTVESH
jgi:hypothetical protein